MTAAEVQTAVASWWRRETAGREFQPFPSNRAVPGPGIGPGWQNTGPFSQRSGHPHRIPRKGCKDVFPLALLSGAENEHRSTRTIAGYWTLVVRPARKFWTWLLRRGTSRAEAKVLILRVIHRGGMQPAMIIRNLPPKLSKPTTDYVLIIKRNVIIII